jgi:hypothetical protein
MPRGHKPFQPLTRRDHAAASPSKMTEQNEDQTETLLLQRRAVMKNEALRWIIEGIQKPDTGDVQTHYTLEENQMEPLQQAIEQTINSLVDPKDLILSYQNLSDRKKTALAFQGAIWSKMADGRSQTELLILSTNIISDFADFCAQEAEKLSENMAEKLSVQRARGRQS